MPKHRVAILGGGMAALTTAYQLSRTAALRERFEVTIYQMGWRLGGKCATGRGLHGRVEEHGIHLFGGGYYNALPLMKDVYDALRHEIGCDVDFDRSFEPQYTSLRFEGAHPGLRKTATRFPRSPVRLDTLKHFDDIRAWVARLPRVLHDLLQAAANKLPSGPGLAALLRAAAAAGAPNLPNLKAIPSFPDLLRLLDELGREIDVNGANQQRVLARFVGTVQPFEPLLRALPKPLRDAAVTANYFGALIQGTLVDVLGRGLGFNRLDEGNFDVWLRGHGAWKDTVASPVALAPIRILYQYPMGDATRPPSMGAGAYLHWALRSFAYIEAPFWFFREGTGETVVKPLYQLLLHRGVRFEFFHRAEAVRLDAGQAGVAAVDFIVQARTTAEQGPCYNPLDENGHWPNRPDHRQLENGAAIAALPDGEFENYWSTWSSGRKTIVRGDHFDTLVFAISLGAVPFVAPDLVARSAAWREMVERIPTTETQSVQLWFTPDSEALGIDVDLLGGPIREDDSGLGCGLAAPFDGLCDFSLLLEEEAWPVRPGALWYFSDMLAHGPAPRDLADPGYPARRAQVAFAQARAFVEGPMLGLLPRAADAAGRFDPAKLHVDAGVPGATPDERLAAQLVRANVQPSDRYVQAPADTTRWRLAPGDAQFDGLVLAGDWTYTGLNAGCVEAAVMSGQLAANAITGDPPGEGVRGYFPP